MPFYLRKIRKPRWNNEHITWLEEGDIHADPLGDLTTTDNMLSVYMVDDAGEMLKRLIPALATSKTQHLSNFDFVLFDVGILNQIEVRVIQQYGSTPDEKISECHYHLIELSGWKLTALVKEILSERKKKPSRVTIARFSQKQVHDLVIQAINSGWLDPSKFEPELRARLYPS